MIMETYQAKRIAFIIINTYIFFNRRLFCNRLAGAREKAKKKLRRYEPRHFFDQEEALTALLTNVFNPAHLQLLLTEIARIWSDDMMSPGVKLESVLKLAIAIDRYGVVSSNKQTSSTYDAFINDLQLRGPKAQKALDPLITLLSAQKAWNYDELYAATV